jgi:ABC-type branched-subunit amino acid transport system substrate-binding protein
VFPYKRRGAVARNGTRQDRMRVKTFLVKSVRRRPATALASCALFSLILLAVAAPAGAQGGGGVSSQERAAFARAQNQYASGDVAGAAAAFEKFLVDFPKSEMRSEAATLLGHIRLEQKAYQPAIALLSDVVALGVDGSYADRARLDLASAYLGVGDKPKAAKLLAVLAASEAAPGLRQQAYEMLTALAIEDHDLARGVSFLMDERGLPADVVDSAAVDARIRDLIEQAKTPGELESIADAFPGRFPADIALVRAAQLYATTGEGFDQERMLQQFLTAFPRHELAPEALKTLETNRARLRSAKSVIVLPLPHGGALQPYATSLLRGAQLAVESARTEGGDLSIVLAAKDYGGDLARLGSVLDQTCREARCVGIVGPVLSREAPVVASRAAQWRVPAVSPTATGPMPPSRYLFRTALTAQAEGLAVARYAIQHLGMKRFVVLAPQDRYSVDIVTAFSEEVARQGGRLIFSATYQPGSVDFGSEIKRLREVDLRQEGVMETLPAENTAPDAPAPEPVYLPGFDAAFLPGDGETVGLIASQLRFYDITVPLLGSSGWNNRAVIANGGKFVEDAIFVDAFFANSQDAAVEQFVKQYRARYREAPDVFAALAYDATLLLVRGLKAGATTGERLRDELTKITGHSGVSGITGFGPDGDVERQFSWIQIRNGRFVPAL